MLKHLRNVARNIAHKFSVSSMYFAELSANNDFIDVEIELISESIMPLLFDIERNRILVKYCKDNFYYLLTDMEKQRLKTATLKAHFYSIEEIIFGDFTLVITLDNDVEITGNIVTTENSIYLLKKKRENEVLKQECQTPCCDRIKSFFNLNDDEIPF